MSDLTEQRAKLAALADYRRDWSLLFYKPYPKQREFHALGATIRERILLAGNQLGKTYAAAMEMAMHLTGYYPDWWTGKRFRKAPRFWAGNETSELTRDGPQRLLLGPVGSWKTGAIPAPLIIDVKRARGVPDAVETILVKHKSGGTAAVTFKAYKDGRTAWQTETLDGIWFDEEPPVDIYGEGLARTTTTGGPVWITFTPAKGLSQVVAKFWPRPVDTNKAFVLMNMQDALEAGHIAPEAYEAEIAKYEEYERQYRVWGLPSMGTGLIYPVSDELITEDDLDYVPEHWKRIIGLDIGGWDHPTAAVDMAYDADTDTIHLLHEYRLNKQLPVVHADNIKKFGLHPVAWPHDALQHDKGGSCEQIVAQYRQHGLKTLPHKAEFEDDRGYGVEAGILCILQYMQTGRFRVARSLTAWHEERRGYHRKPNQQGVPRIVKERDDLMDATRYAFMMLRYARAPEPAEPKPDAYTRRRKRRAGATTWMGH